MKLFTRYNRINVLSTVVIFIFASAAFSFLLRYVVLSQIDEDLIIEKNEVLTYVNKYGALPSIVEVHDQYTTYAKTDKRSLLPDHIYTRKIKDRQDDDLIRTIAFSTEIGNQFYAIQVSKSLEATDNLIQSIILITIVTILLILAATFFINRLVLRRLWQPFYTTLQTVQQFKLSNNNAVVFSAGRYR